MKNVHIGSVIRQKLEESSFSIAEFASLINRTRTTVYDIFERKSIDVDLLLSISEVLNYNFMQEVYLMKNTEQGSVNTNAFSTCCCRYIVGVEVNEAQLKEYLNSENQIIFKIITKLE